MQSQVSALNILRCCGTIGCVTGWTSHPQKHATYLQLLLNRMSPEDKQ